jgi:hypothetical protein
MNVNSRQKNAALIVAVAAAAGVGLFTSSAQATLYTTSTSKEFNVETAGPYPNATTGNTATISTYYSPTSGYQAFDIYNFNSLNFNIPAGQAAASVNSDAILDLSIYNTTFNSNSTFEAYLTL